MAGGKGAAVCCEGEAAPPLASAPGAVSPDSGKEAMPFDAAEGSLIVGTMSSKREVAASSLIRTVSGRLIRGGTDWRA